MVRPFTNFQFGSMTDAGQVAARNDVACDCVSNMVAPIEHFCFSGGWGNLHVWSYLEEFTD